MKARLNYLAALRLAHTFRLDAASLPASYRKKAIAQAREFLFIARILRINALEGGVQ